jgi:hypothetical protein
MTGSKLQRVLMAQAPSTNRRRDKRPSPPRQAQEPSLAKFALDPIKGVDSLLRLRRKDAVASVLSHPEFASSLGDLALKAAQSIPAALSLSRLVLHPAFSTAATGAVIAKGEWPDASKFSASHRRLVADALERARPTWALPWLGQALLAALPYADLRRFFISRLFLAAGGLHATVATLTNLISTLEPRAKRASDLLALVDELRNCARPTRPVSSGADPSSSLSKPSSPTDRRKAVLKSNAN